MRYRNNSNNSNNIDNLFTCKFTRLSATVGIALALLSPGLQSSSRGDTPFLSHTDGSITPIAARRLPDNYKTSLTNLLHWTHFPLRVTFVNGMASGNHDLDTLVRNGFDEWVNATQGAVCYEVVSNDRRADVTVTYDVVSSRPLNGERLGQTGFSFNPARKQLNRATMHLNVWEGMKRHDLARFQNTAAHEFGHALGINGHSPIPGDLMYYTSSSAEGVTDRDVNTLRLAYGRLDRTADRANDDKTKRM
jgi:predicted Zn-dependent protease